MGRTERNRDEATGRFAYGGLERIIHERAAWSHDAAEDKTVVPMCGGKSAEVCPIKSFYYRTDVPFMKAIQ